MKVRGKGNNSYRSDELQLELPLDRKPPTGMHEAEYISSCCSNDFAYVYLLTFF